MEYTIKETIEGVVNNFLYEYRGNSYNKGSMYSVNDNYVREKITRWSDNGYIVVPLCGVDASKDESEESAHTCNEKVKQFIDDIKTLGFTYTPVYGCFVADLVTGDEKTVYERSAIIYNRDKHGNGLDFNDLLALGQALCRKYNQTSFLAQSPTGKPQYVKPDGSIAFEFGWGQVFNDLCESFFLDLHLNTHNLMPTRTPTRFRFTGAFVNPRPQCYSERHVRWLNGEVY